MARLDIKGQNNTLLVVFYEGTGEELHDLLTRKLTVNPQLFRGSPVMFQGPALERFTHEELIALQRLCLDHGMFFMSPPAAPRELKPLARPELPTKVVVAAPVDPVASLAPHNDLTVTRTLRSGQKAHSEGSLMVWGDVHESAELVAAEDIIVLGRLDGMAHAGCYGDRERRIFALSLYPKQLRIADRISRSSGEMQRAPYPEMAFLENDAICICKYDSRQGQRT